MSIMYFSFILCCNIRFIYCVGNFKVSDFSPLFFFVFFLCFESTLKRCIEPWIVYNVLCSLSLSVMFSFVPEMEAMVLTRV